MKDDINSDTQLTRRIASGEGHALEQFYDRYADALYAYIYHSLDGVKEDAEDIWQESLLAAIRGIGGFQGQSRLFTWLCAIARRKIADHFRKLGRTVDQTDGNPLGDLTTLIDQSPLPETWIQEKTTGIYVVEVLQALPRDYRQVLVARYTDEKSVKEIARMLGKSYKATESLLTRARLAFQTRFIQNQGER